MKETVKYDDIDDRLIVTTTYDNSAVLDQNVKARNETHGRKKYQGDFVRVGSIHEGDIVRLKNMGYNLLSHDMGEVKRALLYIQSNEPHLLTVEGRPFAKVRAKWH